MGRRLLVVGAIQQHHLLDAREVRVKVGAGERVVSISQFVPHQVPTSSAQTYVLNRCFHELARHLDGRA